MKKAASLIALGAIAALAVVWFWLRRSEPTTFTLPETHATQPTASATATASAGVSAVTVDEPAGSDTSPVAERDDRVAQAAKDVFDALDRGVTPTFVDYLTRKGLSREDSEKIVADVVRDMTRCVVDVMGTQASTPAARFKIEAGNPPAELPELFFSDRAGACMSGVEQRMGLPPNVTFEMSA